MASASFLPSAIDDTDEGAVVNGVLIASSEVCSARFVSDVADVIEDAVDSG